MMINNQRLATLVLTSWVSGCSSIVPDQLIEARGAYAKSSNGLSAKLTPTDLYDARKALDSANKEFDEHGDTPRVRDYA